LSDQLFYDHGERHELVRSHICDYLERHQSEYVNFLVLDEDDHCGEQDADDYESYVEAMRQDGEWGGNLELVVAARLYRRDITVFEPNMSAYTISHNTCDDCGDKSSDQKKKTMASSPPFRIFISYHDNQHYNSVRINSQPNPPPPPSLFLEYGGQIMWDDKVPRDDNLRNVNINLEEGIENDTGGGDGNNSLTDGDSIDDDEPGRITAQTSQQRKQQQQQQPKKSAPCPCGSGLRYKKCCLPRQKHEKRVQRMMVTRSAAGKSCSFDDDDDDDSGGGGTSMEGNFVKLHI